MIDASEAMVTEFSDVRSFFDLILYADNYNDIDFNSLNKDYTYIFELVSPMSQIVLKYAVIHLYHLGTRNNITGEELNINIGIEKPNEYPLHSMEEVLDAVEKLNSNKDSDKIESVEHEGFVVVDKDYRRIKVKTPEYLIFHSISGNTTFSKSKIIELIRSGRMDIKSLSDQFPSFAHYFKYYDYKVTELNYQAKVFIDLTRRVYEEFSQDRKQVALIIKNHRLAPFGFMSIRNDNSSESIVNELPLNKYIKYIPDYIPERLSSLFYGGKDDKENN